jgi:DNA invertase Pin-like site-specific DNA recombinase
MSSEIQVKHGESHRRQLENIENWCKANNKTLDTEFKLEDLGVSAFKGANIQHSSKLGQFLQAIQDGKIASGSTLLVESLDRISRQEILKSLAILQSICDAGITVHTLSDSKSYNAENINDIGSLIYSLLIFSRSNEESKLKADRLKEAWVSKFENIENRILTRNTPFWITYDEDKKEFYLNDRVNVIRKIFSMSIEGYGAVSIIKELHKHHTLYPPLTKSGWNTATIQYCLVSPASYGTFSSKYTVTPIPKYFPEAISYQEFLLSQDARQLRNNGRGSGRKGNTYTNLFSRIIVCGGCGSPVNYQTNGRNAYLRCMKAIKSEECVARSWAYEQFQENFLKWATEINLTEIFTPAGKQTEIQTLNQTINNEILLITAKQKQYDSIINDITTEGLSKSVILAMGKKADAIEAEIISLNESLKVNKSKLSGLELSTDKHVDLVENIKAYNQLTDNKSKEEMRAVRMKIHQSLLNLIETITLYNNKYYKVGDFINGKLMDGLNFRRYKTDIAKQNYLLTDAGQRFYDEHRRYYEIKFKNGQVRKVLPFLNVSRTLAELEAGEKKRLQIIEENLELLKKEFGQDLTLDDFK